MFGRPTIVILSFVSIVAILVLSASLIIEDFPYDYDSLTKALADWRSKTEQELPAQQERPLTGSVYDFFGQVYDAQPPPHLQLSALEAECSASDWHSNLYFQCILMQGGLTTLMSQVKTCLHMTIELGANLIIPTTPVRRVDDLISWDENNRKPLGRWFDRDFLVEKLSTTCPRMHIVTLDENQEPEIPVAHKVAMDYSKSPFEWGFGPYETLETPWKQWFEDTIATQVGGEASGNIVLQAATPSQFFNVTDDSRHDQQAWFELSHMLRARPRPREIIAKILDALRDTNGNHVPFFGVHFRVEDDVKTDNYWTPVEQQISRIWETVEEVRNAYEYPAAVPKRIYLACGDAEQVANFRAGAAEHGWEVFDKWSVAESLGTEVLQAIDELDFDHEAMIDMGILVISDFFIGLGASAFSFTIAHDRSPTGRYLGSSLRPDAMRQDPRAWAARTHLYNDGGFAYQCCL